MELAALPAIPLGPVGSNPETTAAQARGGNRQAIEAAATGFESMFASLLIKSMRQSLEEDTLFPGDKGEVLGGLFDFLMGQHLAKGGALGIASVVRAQLQPRGES